METHSHYYNIRGEWAYDECIFIGFYFYVEIGQISQQYLDKCGNLYYFIFFSLMQKYFLYTKEESLFYILD